MSKTHDLEEVTFKAPSVEAVNILKGHYLEQQPVMVGDVSYMIDRIVVNLDPFASSNTANPYTVRMYVYPVDNSVKKTNCTKNCNKELLEKVSPKFLNHKGKRLSALYKQLDEIKEQIKELEEE